MLISLINEKYSTFCSAGMNTAERAASLDPFSYDIIRCTARSPALKTPYTEIYGLQFPKE